MPYLLCVEVIKDARSIDELKTLFEEKTLKIIKKTRSSSSTMHLPILAAASEFISSKSLILSNPTVEPLTIQIPTHLRMENHQKPHSSLSPIEQHNRIQLRRKSSYLASTYTSENPLDGHSDKLRTAAILLSQLYQQESANAKETQSYLQGKNIKPKADIILGARFEHIRNKVVLEMMIFEEQRLTFMKDHDYEMSTNDEKLNHEQEVHLNQALEKSMDDPSGNDKDSILFTISCGFSRILGNKARKD